MKLKALHPEMGRRFPWPARKSPGAAGMDLCAAIDDAVTLAPGERRLVPCGFAMALDPGHEAQIRPRSGLALEHGVTVLNAPGTIDEDFRGPVQVLLVNHGQKAFTIEPAARIAQMVIAAVARPEVEIVVELDATSRGAGGFGSTGR